MSLLFLENSDHPLRVVCQFFPKTTLYLSIAGLQRTELQRRMQGAWQPWNAVFRLFVCCLFSKFFADSYWTNAKHVPTALRLSMEDILFCTWKTFSVHGRHSSLLCTGCNKLPSTDRACKSFLRDHHGRCFRRRSELMQTKSLRYQNSPGTQVEDDHICSHT